MNYTNFYSFGPFGKLPSFGRKKMSTTVDALSRASPFLLAAEMIIVDLHGKDDSRADSSDEVGDHEGPVGQEESLNHEEDAPESEQEEGRDGNTVGITSADGVDGLWKIAHHHAEGGSVADNINDQLHIIVVKR